MKSISRKEFPDKRQYYIKKSYRHHNTKLYICPEKFFDKTDLL